MLIFKYIYENLVLLDGCWIMGLVSSTFELLIGFFLLDSANNLVDASFVVDRFRVSHEPRARAHLTRLSRPLPMATMLLWLRLSVVF